MRSYFINILSGLLIAAGAHAQAKVDTSFTAAANPIITHKFTADPAALVYGGKVWLFTGHDQAPDKRNGYEMHEWLCFSTSDMKHWEEHPSPMKVTDFSWAKDDAWASQVVERNGKFYWYVAVSHKTIHGKSIGVAVADHPWGPYKDARGSAIITNDMTTETKISWDDIDPTVIIDKGRAWLFWGNTFLHYAPLKDNMTELDGPVRTIDLPAFTEAPWIHFRNGLFYLSYATGFPERIAYATSKSVEGPWTYRGILNELAGNCNTNHQAIIDFKGRSYFIYHNGALVPDAGSFHRSVCIDYLYYNKDGTMKRVVMTSEGVPEIK
jgi:beta-xylosidase